MLKFTQNYLVFDEFGIKQVSCMACNKPIKTRSEIMSKDGSRMIRELSKHNDYREIPVILEGNKIAFIMVCDECKFVSIGEEEAKDITRQLSQALKMQLEFEGKDTGLIDEILKVQTYNVLRKADVHEVTAALGRI